jgi:aspartate/tyrosine/aromatic aminotransferase
LLNLLHFHGCCFNPKNKEEKTWNEILHMLWCVAFICLFTLFYIGLQDGQGN